MRSKRYIEEFRPEAVKPATDRGRSVAEVAGQLIYSLHAWRKQPLKSGATRQAYTDQAAELPSVKSELGRMTEERDIPIKAAAHFRNQSG